MTAPITVLTVTIPGREPWLIENVRSVYAQTVPVARQLICAHRATEGVQPMVEYSTAKNEMMQAVKTEWIAVLNDDDYWLPHHVETILPYLTEDADVVYSWEQDGHKPRVDVGALSQFEREQHWETTNEVDGSCAFRAETLLKVGDFPTNWVGNGPWEGGHYEGTVARFEDWEVFRRLNKAGARFTCVPEVTWVYRVGVEGQISEP